MNRVQKMSNKVEQYQDIITRRNYVNLKKFTIGGMIITGVLSVAALLGQGKLNYFMEYSICFLAFIISYFFTRFVLVKNIKYTAITFYIILLPIYIVGILMGTFLDPESSAISIFILLCTLTMFITDKPQRLFGFLFTIIIMFLICSFNCKDFDLFLSDLVNTIVYFSIGAGVNILTLSDRLESAENYALVKDRADKDILTSLLNRGAGERIAIRMLENARTGSFFIVDIDNFKYFNDSYGHQVGDEVICAVSNQLKEEFRKSDIVFRLGGDEFAVFAIDLEDRLVCEEHMNQLQQKLLSIHTSYPEPLHIRVSIGCTICHITTCDFDALYKSSDDALYIAKNNGKNCFYIKEIQ